MCVTSDHITLLLLNDQRVCVCLGGCCMRGRESVLCVCVFQLGPGRKGCIDRLSATVDGYCLGGCGQMEWIPQ